MLEKCPIVDSQKLFPCGAYFHGWLNATNPVPLDGTVNRTMCFSDLTSCNCRRGLARRIQMRNCGNYFVYKLYNLNDICSGDIAENARYCGMRGKSVVSSSVNISNSIFPFLRATVLTIATCCLLKIYASGRHS